jgi:hypothetical protein
MTPIISATAAVTAIVLMVRMVPPYKLNQLSVVIAIPTHAEIQPLPDPQTLLEAKASPSRPSKSDLSDFDHFEMAKWGLPDFARRGGWRREAAPGGGLRVL